MSIHLKKRILEALENVKHQPDNQERYKAILKFVKDQNISTTRNKRGYWFDLTSLPDTTITELHNFISTQLVPRDGSNDHEEQKLG